MNRQNQRTAKTKGFTLIEASIVLLVLGIVMVPILKEIDREFLKRKVQITSSRFETISEAIAQYYFVNQTYPCPANPSLGPSSPLYGTAEPCNPGGYNAGGAITFASVSYGAVPFKDLKIDASTTMDRWGAKIMYAVSTAMTAGAPIEDTDGTLSLMGWQSTPVNPADPYLPYNAALSWSLQDLAAGQGHYILISPGPTNVGGYNADGNLIQACPNPPNTFDAENCDGDTTFNVYQYRDFIGTAYARSDVPGPNFYDDVTLFNDSLHTRMWNSAPDPNDIFTETNGRIGIGQTPEVDVALDVNGNIRTGGNATAIGLCDGSISTASASCFSPQQIAGSVPSLMECDPTAVGPDDSRRPMGGVAYSSVSCNDVPPYYTGGASFTCPSGQYVTQITSAGVICSN